MVARLHADPVFRDELEAARAEVTALPAPKISSLSVTVRLKQRWPVDQ